MASRRPTAANKPAAAPPPGGAAPLNAGLLSQITDATNGPAGFSYVDPAHPDVMALTAAGQIELNHGMKNEAGHVAARASGANGANGADPSPSPSPSTAAPKFKIRSGIVAPERKREGGIGREETYPFSTLNVGDGFHVPKTDKMPDPARSLQSTVSSANARFADEAKDANGNVIMEPRQISVGRRDAAGNVIRDSAGKMIRETHTEMKPKLEYTKRFTVFAVGKDDPDGEGAIITRTK